jgi:ATP-dependent DNA helicase DinG
MGLAERIQEVFAAGGVLAHAAAGTYKVRPGQVDMALGVGKAVEAGGVLVVEAGTGVGKTFAYLVPALLSGERVLLSTATKNLQDQLFGRDLPFLMNALGLTLRLAVLKGRSSYLCLQRLERARFDFHPIDRSALQTLADIERWSLMTRSGDVAELDSLDEHSMLLPWVTSTRENCLGAQCPKVRSCHVNLARKEAMAADVLVVNHHVFFADLAVRETGMAELLPTVRVAIFDEAHQLNEIGVQFLGTHCTTGQILDLARDLLAAGLQQARGLVDWQQIAFLLERAARELRLVVGSRGNSRLRWAVRAPEGVVEDVWLDALVDVLEALRQAALNLDTVSELAPDFVRLYERALVLRDVFLKFSQSGTFGVVRWLEVGMHLRLVESPLDIAQAAQSRLFGGEDCEGGRSWIFTSATLGNDAQLSWFTKQCGLGDANCLRVESPFDYINQAGLYVPRNLPKPSDASHSAQVAVFAAAAVRELGGRTMVLTTSLRALQVIGDVLRSELAKDAAIEILLQGSRPKRHLMERFRQGSSSGQTGCVLVASASFWEGVDVPGDALQLVIIDKLPFPPPNDPVVEARTQRIESEGGSPFIEYFVPEASIALKQGVGRLIRSEADRGVIVVCDVRLVTMGYGKRLRASLPPMRLLKSEGEFQEALLALTKSSTTAHL